jgi:hypothetical protein
MHECFFFILFVFFSSFLFSLSLSSFLFPLSSLLSPLSSLLFPLQDGGLKKNPFSVFAEGI